MSGDERASRSWFDRIGQLLSGEPQDRQALVEVLRDAERRHLLDPDALAIIEGALEVSELQVRDVMVPRSQMVVIRAEEKPDEFVHPVLESGHSRFPVVGDSRDDVEGILHAKDLLSYFAQPAPRDFDIYDIIRPVVYIPESKRLNVLLSEFRTNRNHMAIVADEYGGVAGLVTIEDVLEQIVGEIDDEHDTDEGQPIKRLGEDEFTVKALTPIEDFNEYFDTSFSDEEFDTVGGLVINAFGRFPRRGDTAVVSRMRFEVLRADKRRVHLLRVRTLGEAVDEPEREED